MTEPIDFAAARRARAQADERDERASYARIAREGLARARAVLARDSTGLEVEEPTA